jgi:O-antigen/teichoic acid export membrane protein
MESMTPLARSARGAFDLRSLAGDAGLVIGGALAANLLNYVFHFVISRRLGPDDYGTLTALLAIAAMTGPIGASLSSVALQETAKLWVRHRDDHIGEFVRHASPAVFGIAAALWVAVVGASFAIGPYLHIASADLWLAFATYCAAVTGASFLRGCAQGAHKFAAFASSLIGEAIVKLTVSVILVMIGWRVLGALGGFITGIAFAGIVLLPLISKRPATSTFDKSEHTHLRLGGESFKVLGVTAFTAVLMFVDTLFAKHHLSGVDAGYYGAAGTLARIIPYGVALISLVLMPKAAAALHSSRDSLVRLLRFAVGAGLILTGVLVALFVFAPGLVIAISYGAKFAASGPLLRLYGIDGGILALLGLGLSYLIAVRDYLITRFLVVAVALEAVVMATLGTTPVRLLSIAIAINAALLPPVIYCVLRTIGVAPQAPNPPPAEV